MADLGHGNLDSVLAPIVPEPFSSESMSSQSGIALAAISNGPADDQMCVLRLVLVGDVVVK